MKRLIDLTPSDGGPVQALGSPERGGELLRADELPGEVAPRDELRQAAAGADAVDWTGGRCGDEGDGGGI